MGGITHECLAHPLIRLAGHVLEAIQRGYWPSVGWATVLYKLSTETNYNEIVVCLCYNFLI